LSRPLRWLRLAGAVLLAIWELAVIFEPKTARAALETKAVFETVLATKSIIEYDKSIKPDGDFSCLKSYCVTDRKRVFHQAIQRRISLVAGADDQIIGQGWAYRVLSQTRQFSANNDLVTKLFYDGVCFTKVLERKRYAQTFKVVIKSILGRAEAFRTATD
jgi:hypothetical protein